MKEEIIAHAVPNGKDEYSVQPLLEHLLGVGKLAQNYAERITPCKGIGQIGYLLGLLHDVGKYQKGFQRYLRSATGLEPDGLTERTPHSPAGARYVNALREKEWGKNLNKILSLCIAAHHRGLYDDPAWREMINSVEVRSREKALQEGIKGEVARLNEYIDAVSIAEITKALSQIDEEDYPLLLKMLFSCLVDADFIDTERFMSPGKSVARQSAKASLEQMRERLEKYVSQFDGKGRINEVRTIFLNRCRSHGQATSRGIYSLTLPTGAGKTISSMMWALKHAIARGCERIIYVIPYTSIITQTAETFREIFGMDNVLEHHSDIDVKEQPDEVQEYNKLLTENWDFPLIITTNVQFFESLFSNRVARCRKLHNICNSVVVFDEAQMFPPELLNPMLQMLQSLNYSFRTELLLCTATLPIFDKDLSNKNRDGQNFFCLEEPIEEVVPYDAELFTAFDKVTYHWSPLKLSTDELAEHLLQNDSFLCIVNSRKDAVRVYASLKERYKGDDLIHLSRRMCALHIQNRLKEIKERLRLGQSVKVISTQLVEAGVDLDFPVVYRAMAGLDSIMQAAGRCNREGRLRMPGKVYIFRLTEERNANGELGLAQGSLEDMMDQLVRSGTPQQADIEHYYRSFYSKVRNFDAKGVAKLLWGDEDDQEERIRSLRFDYEKASDQFKYIEDHTKQIVVPYGKEGKELIEKIQRNIPLRRNDYRLLHRLSVGIYEKDYLTLGKSILSDGNDILYLTDEQYYSNDIGIDIANMNSELLIVSDGREQ